MGFANYTELQASVADWLDRSDLSIQIPDFIRLAEVEMIRRLRLQVQEALQYNNTVPAYQWLPLPPGYRGVKSLRLNDTDTVIRLIQVTQATMDQRPALNQQGMPKYFTIIGDRIRLGPIPASTWEVEGIFQSGFPFLSTIQATNDILTETPDLYLYATLMQAEPFIKDDQRVALWSAKVEGLYASIELDNERKKFSSGPLQMQHDYSSDRGVRWP